METIVNIINGINVTKTTNEPSKDSVVKNTGRGQKSLWN